MLPLQGVPVARRRRLLGLQIIERRPVVDDPGRLLQSNPSHAASLDFKAAMLTNQRKKVVPDRERTVVVGCYQFQAHVIVTAVHVPTAKRAAGDGILGLFLGNGHHFSNPPASWTFQVAARWWCWMSPPRAARLWRRCGCRRGCRRGSMATGLRMGRE